MATRSSKPGPSSSLTWITRRMLTRELRELEKDGPVIRNVYAQVPPKVEYSLTETAESFIPILDQLCDRGSEHLGDEIAFRCEEE